MAHLKSIYDLLLMQMIQSYWYSHSSFEMKLNENNNDNSMNNN